FHSGAGDGRERRHRARDRAASGRVSRAGVRLRRKFRALLGRRLVQFWQGGGHRGGGPGARRTRLFRRLRAGRMRLLRRPRRAHGSRRKRWLVDACAHAVYKTDGQGKVVMTLGRKGVSGTSRGEFNLPTDIAFAPDGSIYVSDGYGSARGEYLMEFGKRGTGPGEFGLPHNLAVDAQGRVYVTDLARPARLPQDLKLSK